jgi:CoA-dependent NAD(P)H sulfur oxidoreductase
MERILIVGGIAAGMKAAATARRRRPDLDIVVLQDEAEVSYSACGLPYSLGDPAGIPRASLVARTPERFQADGIDVRTRHRAEEVDVRAGLVRARSLDTGASVVEPFDRILFATGAQPVMPQFPAGEGSPQVVPLRSFGDADLVSSLLRPGGHIAIIGGGYIGLEMAEALRLQGQELTLIEAAPRLLPSFGSGTAEAVAEELARHGVIVHLQTSIREAAAGGFALSDGRFLKADAAVAAIGVRPRVELAAAAGVALGKTGAIAVDNSMRTNLEGVYAAGDCTEARHIVSGQAVWFPLGDIANRQGRVAGVNMADGEAHFPGVLGTAIFKVFGLAVARTGLTLEQARQSGFVPVEVHVKAPSRARYMPESRTIDAILIADQASGRLLGAEAYGGDGVDKYIDVAATAIWGKLTADDMAELDLAYAPPFSPVFAAVQVAGELTRKKCGASAGTDKRLQRHRIEGTEPVCQSKH